MEAIVILILIYFAIYAIYIGRLIYGYARSPKFIPDNSDPLTTFSIIIPFRNEAPHLPALLESIKNLDYPSQLFEIILVDDLSDDNSQSIIYKWRMDNGNFHTTMLENVIITGSPKKDAINRAVPIVANQWIVTTDADCILPSTWLSALNDFILKSKAEMIAGPVVYNAKGNFLTHFQQMDLMSLQAATIGSFGIGKAFMCNGANFAYTKKLFAELGGFSGNTKIAGGDDVFLLQKAMIADSRKVAYIKSAESIVKTTATPTWKSLFSQRVRWASKSTEYQSDFGELLAINVFLGNAGVIALLEMAVFDNVSWKLFITVFGIKLLVDTILLIQGNSILRNNRFFFPVFSSILYPFFCVAVAILSIFGRYEWKGRKFRS